MADVAAIDVTVTQTQTVDVAVITVGIQGPPGVGSALVFNQPTPASVWTIDHNFGDYPNVFVLDTNGDECEGYIGNPTLNRTVITFSAAFAGTARLT